MKPKATHDNFPDLHAVKMADLAPRDRVLRTALDLFYAHGVHSVGVDRIIAESGVAKMTFYRHFPSKSKLISAYLAYQSQVWRQLFDRFTGDPARPALDRLLGIFDAVAVYIRHPAFQGCPFIKGMAEFGPERGEPEVRRQITDHFAGGERLVTELLKEIRPKDAKKFIQPMLSLISGTIVVAHATGHTDVAGQNKEFAKRLLTL